MLRIIRDSDHKQIFKKLSNGSIKAQRRILLSAHIRINEIDKHMLMV